MLPDRFTAGDTLDRVIALADYPAPEWSLKFRLIPRGDTEPIGFTCGALGSDHQALVESVDTAAWAAGPYSWAAWVEQDDRKLTVGSGSIDVLPDPRELAGGIDLRSQAEKALADARAALAAWTPTTRRYKIGNSREMEFASSADVLAVVEFWARQVRAERTAANLAAGKRTGRQVFVRIGRG
jgi:enamine deaminase RidA (YjgF/YER057c/UK114 family)